jgi:sulfide:quinone oxidoreductase
MCVDGWIPVDYTLQTEYPGVYAVGDVTSVGTPKAGVFAESQAGIAAERIIESIRGNEPTAEFDGSGICYLEYGNGEVAKVNAVFRRGETPYGEFAPPSLEIAADKKQFGRSRIQRWFGNDWNA